MTTNENQSQEAVHHYDQMIKEIEQVDPEILLSVVPGSQLHAYINSPVTEATDES